MTSLTKLMVRPEILREHRATWWSVSQGTRIRHSSQMRGTWGADVTCSCGWDSRTGGATRGSVEDMLLDHRTSEQAGHDVRQHPCPLCKAAPGRPCCYRQDEIGYLHAERWAAYSAAEESK